MKTSTKVALGIGGAAVVGGVLGYFVATSQAGRRAMKAIEEGDYRLPEPGEAVDLPYTQEQYEILDEIVCECGSEAVDAASNEVTIDELTRQIQECMALQLYPSYDWPPVSGDHPSAQQLWAELGAMARRALIIDEICPAPLASPAVNPRSLRR